MSADKLAARKAKEDKKKAKKAQKKKRSKEAKKLKKTLKDSETQKESDWVVLCKCLFFFSSHHLPFVRK